MPARSQAMKLTLEQAREMFDEAHDLAMAITEVIEKWYDNSQPTTLTALAMIASFIIVHGDDPKQNERKFVQTIKEMVAVGPSRGENLDS